MSDKSLSKSSKRIWEVDFLRALAVLGMVYFHFFYVLDYWNLDQVPLFTNDTWIWFGNAIRNLFFVVVGLGMTLSYQRYKARQKPLKAYYVKELKKGLVLIIIGLAITALSSVYTPEQTIRFGVLSFIGVSVVLVLPLVGKWWWLALALGLVLWFEHQFGETWSHESLWAYILGFYPRYWPSLDYFPLVPWIGSILAGNLIGSFIFKAAQRNYPFLPTEPLGLKPIVWVGQHALIIYVLHLPLTVLIIWELERLGVY